MNEKLNRIMDKSQSLPPSRQEWDVILDSIPLQRTIVEQELEKDSDEIDHENRYENFYDREITDQDINQQNRCSGRFKLDTLV